jgi:quinol-cytochrome oxidoreductase complex cytochrome b subunit
MLNLLKQFLSTYQMEMSPIIAPLIFFIFLFIMRSLLVSFVTSPLRHMDKEMKRTLKKGYKERSFLGWIFWFLAWAILIVAYYGAMPEILKNEIAVWTLCGVSLLISVSFHYLAYALSAMQSLQEKKPSIPIVS